MPTNPIIFLLTLFFTTGLAAQRDSLPPGRNSPSYVWIKTADGRKIPRGFLAGLTDSTLLYAPDFKSLWLDTLTHPFYPTEITGVQLRRRGSAGKGVLLGLLTGFVVGTTTGIISTSNCDQSIPFNFCGLDLPLGIISGSLLGIIPGQLIGGLRFNFSIGQQRDVFKLKRRRMERFLWRGERATRKQKGG